MADVHSTNQIIVALHLIGCSTMASKYAYFSVFTCGILC